MVDNIATWIAGLTVMGLLFWSAIVALSCVLSHRKRCSSESRDNSILLVGSENFGFFTDNISNPTKVDLVDGPRVAAEVDTHYVDVETIKLRKMNSIHQTAVSGVCQPMEAAMGDPSRKDVGTHETLSASMKFGEEDPEWKNMLVQVTFDPSGKADPVITHRPYPLSDVSDDSDSFDSSRDDGSHDGEHDVRDETSIAEEHCEHAQNRSCPDAHDTQSCDRPDTPSSLITITETDGQKVRHDVANAVVNHLVPPNKGSPAKARMANGEYRQGKNHQAHWLHESPYSNIAEVGPTARQWSATAGVRSVAGVDRGSDLEPMRIYVETDAKTGEM